MDGITAVTDKSGEVIAFGGPVADGGAAVAAEFHFNHLQDTVVGSSAHHAG